MQVKRQAGGNGSNNFQADTININQGLTHHQVAEIAQGLFQDNFIELRKEAAQIASDRAKEIVSEVLGKIENDNPEAFRNFCSPGLQNSLFNIQKEYAINGQIEVRDLLVDIIVERAQVQERTVLQTLLDDSIHIAPRLQADHYNLLTLMFLLMEVRQNNITSYNSFKSRVLEVLFEFLPDAMPTRQDYIFLEYLKCGALRTGTIGTLQSQIIARYKCFFSNGFEHTELDNLITSCQKLEPILNRCIHDSSKTQLWTLRDSVLEHWLNSNNIPEADQLRLKELFDDSTMSELEVKGCLEKIDSRMKTVFEIFDDSFFNRFQLSGAGMVIANANYKRKTGKDLDIAKWVS